MSMTSSRPYLIRALFEWIIENKFSPYLLVNTKVPDIQVPQEHVVNDKIIFNISPQAVKNLQIGNETVEFNGRFGGKARSINVPVRAVLAIYAKENGRGMVFNDEEDENGPPAAPTSTQAAAKAKLKLVK